MGKTIHVSGLPSSVHAEDLKTFLESYTGKETVYALKIRQQQGGGRRYAIVQFTKSIDAERIINLAIRRLCYGRSYLKAREADNDIVPKPGTFLHTMENVRLHFGCQVSNEKFYALWRAVGVTVNFGTGMGKLQFLLSDRQSEYKLELFYENIWQIELHRPCNQTSNYLLIQLFGAPRIYEKQVRSSGLVFEVFEDPLLNYFMDVPEDQWTFRASKLLELRTKTRIFVQHGRCMMGCLDETRTLDYGQVFVRVSGSRSEQVFTIEGKVVVAKSPCLHPGDVRVLRAVNVPDLYHMVDCIVFPQKGHRPHPNECSGSDLDGDIYFVSWDPELIPFKQIDPMDYSPAPTTTLDHEVTIEEVEEYFTNYIVNDSLGIISNAHIVFADRQPDKAMSSECLELAKLSSIAVDFPKTGVPAEIPQELRVKEYPDFMEKPDKPTYQSNNVIGKLFREVKDLAPSECFIKSFTRENFERFYDPDMEVDGYEDYVDDAFFHKSNYDYKLGNLMDYCGIKKPRLKYSVGVS